jgi:hypothetical protein
MTFNEDCILKLGVLLTGNRGSSVSIVSDYDQGSIHDGGRGFFF